MSTKNTGTNSLLPVIIILERTDRKSPNLKKYRSLHSIQDARNKLCIKIS